MRATVVFPVPGGPVNTRCRPGFTAFSPAFSRSVFACTTAMILRTWAFTFPSPVSASSSFRMSPIASASAAEAVPASALLAPSSAVCGATPPDDASPVAGNAAFSAAIASSSVLRVSGIAVAASLTAGCPYEFPGGSSARLAGAKHSAHSGRSRKCLARANSTWRGSTSAWEHALADETAASWISVRSMVAPSREVGQALASELPLELVVQVVRGAQHGIERRGELFLVQVVAQEGVRHHQEQLSRGGRVVVRGDVAEVVAAPGHPLVHGRRRIHLPEDGAGELDQRLGIAILVGPPIRDAHVHSRAHVGERNGDGAALERDVESHRARKDALHLHHGRVDICHGFLPRWAWMR